MVRFNEAVTEIGILIIYICDNITCQIFRLWDACKILTAHIWAEIIHRGSLLAITVPMMYSLTKLKHNGFQPIYCPFKTALHGNINYFSIKIQLQLELRSLSFYVNPFNKKMGVNNRSSYIY